MSLNLGLVGSLLGGVGTLLGGLTNSLFPPSPFNNNTVPTLPLCPTTDTATTVNGYPSSPFVLTPFTDNFINPQVLAPKQKICRADGHCMYSYEHDITSISGRPFQNIIPKCQTTLPATELLSYGGTVPGKTIIVPAGHESLVRYNNKLTTGNIAPCNSATRSGTPISVHFHGSASLAPYDGWAEDETCGSETKDYVYPNNRPVTGWYHDHALHITADNAYHGLAGFTYVSAKVKDGGCGEPWNLENVEELHMMLADKLVDSQCQLYADHAGAHKDDLYGDINTISGIPFPLMNLQPKWYRLRLLNAAVTRPYLFQVRNQFGNQTLHQNICKVIAGDGGYRETPVNVPAAGVLLGVAERWEVVCDFTNYAGQTLYFWNDRDDLFMKDTPYFCLSHLLAKVQVAPASTASLNAAKFDATAPGPAAALIPMKSVLSDADYNQAVTMAQNGQFHREMAFGKTGNMWTINGETWDSFKIAASDVGQNTWELWKFSSGGGWYHPVHMHLVDFFIVHREDVGVKSYELKTPKDVLFLGGGKTIYAIARFGAHRGQYMFHCHNLIHEDNDMMRAMNIMRNPSPSMENNVGSSQYYTNEIYNVIYYNYNYADPMLGTTAAKPTTTVSAHTATYISTMLGLNLYRVFYPTTADKNTYNGAANPWESNWCPRTAA